MLCQNHAEQKLELVPNTRKFNSLCPMLAQQQFAPGGGYGYAADLQLSRQFPFIPVRNIIPLLLGLWSCGQAQLVQTPVRQPEGLSIRRGKSISLKKNK
jgi:hypothetical protein